MATFEAAIPQALPIRHPDPAGSVSKTGDSPTSVLRTDAEEREAKCAFIEGILGQLFFLKGLTREDVSLFVDAMVEERFGAGEVVFSQGAVGDKFYIIKDGRCGIELDGVGKVKEIPAGGYFGELALLYDAPRSASVVALGPMGCYGLDERTFDGLVSQCTARLVAPLKKLEGITLCPPEAHYAVGAFLGDGQFAEVFEARSNDGMERAIKVVDLSAHDADVAVALVNEVEAMRKLRGHANVLNVHDCYLSGSTLSVALDLCRGGDLFDRIAAKGPLADGAASAALSQLLDAVVHCHGASVIHRDLKPENVMYLAPDGAPGDDVLKVGDFGLACSLHAGETLHAVVGTPVYAAPEVAAATADRGYGFPSDLYSLGMVLYVMCAGALPEDLDADPRASLGGPDFREASPGAVALCRALIDPDPATRATPDEARASPWLSSGVARSASLRAAENDAATSIMSPRSRAASRARWAAVRHAVLATSSFTSTKAPAQGARLLDRLREARAKADAAEDAPRTRPTDPPDPALDGAPAAPAAVDGPTPDAAPPHPDDGVVELEACSPATAFRSLAADDGGGVVEFELVEAAAPDLS